MKKTIVMVENNFKTISWIKSLKGKDYNLIILSPMRHQAEFVIAEFGIDASEIIDISSQKYEESLSMKEEGDVNLDIELVDLNIYSIIAMDRMLSKESIDLSESYLGFIYREYSKVLSNNDVSCVFMEATWAHEILISEVSKNSNIPVFSLHTIRIPFDRFAFFLNHEKSNTFKRNVVSDDFIKIAEDAYSNVVELNKKPEYFYRNNKKNNIKLSYVRILSDLIINSIKNEQNRFLVNRTPVIVWNKICKLFNRKLVSISEGFVDFKELPEKYIFVTLHVQPESSIDVLCHKLNNQVENIRALSRTTPQDYRIVVKEHSNALGDRPLNFYKELRKIPGVILVDPTADSHMLMKKSTLVISGSGTSSYESALLGTPSVTYSNMYFSNLLLQDSFNPYVDSVSELLSAIPAWKHSFSKEWCVKNIQSIVENSFHADASDCKKKPFVLNDDNIDALRIAFDEVIQTLK